MRFQMSITVALLTALWICLLPGSVEAGGRLPALRCRGGGQGQVIFDHQLHASQGFRCNDCHTEYKGTGQQLLTTRKQGLISVVDHKTGTKCFACHNGKEAFNACDQCHRKVAGL